MKTDDYQPFFTRSEGSHPPSFETIKALAFTEIPNLQKFEDIGNLKRLKGDDNAYRIRIGDYRLGILLTLDDHIYVIKL